MRLPFFLVVGCSGVLGWSVLVLFTACKYSAVVGFPAVFLFLGVRLVSGALSFVCRVKIDMYGLR